MGACYKDQNRLYPATEDIASELDAWLAVSGDIDDFIYFGEDSKDHSEK